MIRHRSTTWLLTGVTGFLGKVMLEELLRRREELSVERVLVLIRSKGAMPARERFAQEVARAECFAALPSDWARSVDVLDGDLSAADLGLSAADRDSLGATTHIVHSAASVSFDLPVLDAARANIRTSLHLLDAARACPVLERFVYVSTAYVTPHPGASVPIEERLVPLPSPATELLERIDAGATDGELLALTGHPNTYTLTKCLTEHLLAERRGSIPLSIVRPSIISAARALPFPGWIDSSAGFGAFVLMIGLGHLRAVIGDPEAQLDLVPVDEVTHCIAHAALLDTAPLSIRHAVAGLSRAPRVGECSQEIERWFRVHRLDRRPTLGFLGKSRPRFRIADWWHHRFPMMIGSLTSGVQRRRAEKLAARIDHLNAVFPYFTTRSFDFCASLPLPPAYHGRRYVAIVCRGLYKHVLRRDDREWAVAGRAHPGHDGDLRWVMGQPGGNGWIRGASWVVTKVLRRTTDAVTVDLPSFERARNSVPGGSAVVLVPSHRSYLDFVLCSYLTFARPDLGFPIPHIAATIEFGRIPLLGRLLSAMHAFYLRRGEGREDPELSRRVKHLLASGQSLEFFVEGARSRTREFLPPKRGLLRCVQASGVPCVLIPIAISYDRLPEEAGFAHELAGGIKPPMQLTGLVRWAWRAFRGRIALGRVHLAAGTALHLNATSSVPAVADALIGELGAAMAITEFHLAAYLAQYPMSGHDAASLTCLIEARGGRVLKSSLRPDGTMSSAVARTMRAHFAAYLPAAVSPAMRAIPAAALHAPLELGRAG